MHYLGGYEKLRISNDDDYNLMMLGSSAKSTNVDLCYIHLCLSISLAVGLFNWSYMNILSTKLFASSEICTS